MIPLENRWQPRSPRSRRLVSHSLRRKLPTYCRAFVTCVPIFRRAELNGPTVERFTHREAANQSELLRDNTVTLPVLDREPGFKMKGAVTDMIFVWLRTRTRRWQFLERALPRR